MSTLVTAFIVGVMAWLGLAFWLASRKGNGPWWSFLALAGASLVIGVLVLAVGGGFQ